jgi:hypothetical protein
MLFYHVGIIQSITTFKSIQWNQKKSTKISWDYSFKLLFQFSAHFPSKNIYNSAGTTILVCNAILSCRYYSIYLYLLNRWQFNPREGAESRASILSWQWYSTPEREPKAEPVSLVNNGIRVQMVFQNSHVSPTWYLIGTVCPTHTGW